MSDYLGITQGTAEWLLGKPSLLDVIAKTFVDHGDMAEEELRAREFVEGPFRMSATDTGDLIALWNVDYLTGTGEEAWGFLTLAGEFGLLNRPDIAREVLERELYIINQRLQSLLLDGALIHRSQENGAHTCLAGRGSTARQVNLGYYEAGAEEALEGQRAIVIVGPAFDFGSLTRDAASRGATLQQVVLRANRLLDPARKKPVAGGESFPGLREALSPYTSSKPRAELEDVEVLTAGHEILPQHAFRALGLKYEDWVDRGSPLSDVQRRILLSDAVFQHPLRIVGPGGSGKTLLLQLLAVRLLRSAASESRRCRIIYIVHNAAMAESVRNRFQVLSGPDSVSDEHRTLDIFTLSEYGRDALGLPYTSVIDPDAQEAKQFQLEQVTAALQTSMSANSRLVAASPLFSELQRSPHLQPIFARIVMAEISSAIKGHGLEADRRRYIYSERRLSRLHGLLNPGERTIIYECYEHYHSVVFEGYAVLDTDDVAISLLGRLRTPLWGLKRREQGYDFVFVDETQLFNENERRVFPLLTTGSADHVPIVLALDEAQDVFVQAAAGMATLGVPDIANESLSSIHRSTRGIVKLAFFVIQRSTDLFGPDFPDFTGIADQMEDDSHPLAAPPRIEVVGADSRLGRFVVRRIRDHRRDNIRQIAVICHADSYWDPLLAALKDAHLPLHVLEQRGERLPSDQPLVVLTRPQTSGGQEFDAVITVGLEQGTVPPRVLDNEALAVAVEQQSLREMYLAFTRARYRLSIVISHGAAPTAVIHEAERAGLLTRRDGAI